MKAALTLRKQLGLSQQQLANFVGAERSGLTRAEHGERGIKPGALLHLAALIKAHKTFREGRSAASSISAELKKDLLLHARHCRQTHASLRKKMKLLQDKHAQARRLQHTVAALQSQSTAPLSKKQQRWLEEQAYQAAKKLERFGDEPQLRLGLRMELLLAEAGIYERAVGGNL